MFLPIAHVKVPYGYAEGYSRAALTQQMLDFDELYSNNYIEDCMWSPAHRCRNIFLICLYSRNENLYPASLSHLTVSLNNPLLMLSQVRSFIFPANLRWL